MQVGTEVGQVKVRIAQAHFVKVYDLEALVSDDMPVMEVLMHGHVQRQFERAGTILKVAGDGGRSLGFLGVVMADQGRPGLEVDQLNGDLEVPLQRQAGTM